VGGEALAQVPQRSCGCSVQGQVGRGFEHPGSGGRCPCPWQGLELDEL